MNWAPLVPELLVSEIHESVSFYTELLGFEIEFTRDEPPFVYCSLGDAQLMLQEEQGDGGNGSERWETGERRYPYGRGVNFQIEVEAVDPHVERLEADGYGLFESVQENWYRVEETAYGNREFLVQDPDGYLLRLVENLGTR